MICTPPKIEGPPPLDVIRNMGSKNFFLSKYCLDEWHYDSFHLLKIVLEIYT